MMFLENNTEAGAKIDNLTSVWAERLHNVESLALSQAYMSAISVN
jgi:hypothetical protein